MKYVSGYKKPSSETMLGSCKKVNSDENRLLSPDRDMNLSLSAKPLLDRSSAI